MVHYLGKMDADGDGISGCTGPLPQQEVGVHSTGGCPDQDLDGIADMEDKCPSTLAKRFSGCPDTGR